VVAGKEVISFELRKSVQNKDWPIVDKLCSENNNSLSDSETSFWIRSKYMIGDFEGCIEISEKVLFDNPRSITALKFNARSKTKLELDYMVIRESWEALLLHEPENFEAMNNIARTLVQEGRIDAASSKISEILDLNPDYPPALTTLTNLRKISEESAVPLSSVSYHATGKKISKASMRKFLRKTDALGGASALVEHFENFNDYVKFCYFLEMPRKLAGVIKIAVDNPQCHDSVISLLETSIIDGRNSVIEQIEKNSIRDDSLGNRVDLTRLRFDVLSRFRGYQPDPEQIERLTMLMNKQNTFSSEDSSEIINFLFLRFKKMFREKEWAVIASLLKDVEFFDWNFQFCKYYIISITKLERKKELERKINRLCGVIEEPINIEDLVDWMYTAGMYLQVIDLCDSKKDIVTFRTNLIYGRALKKLGLIEESERILELSKKKIHSMIKEDSLDVSGITKSIMDIGYSGDIQSSERLLFELTSRNGLSSEIVDKEHMGKFIGLVNDTLNRQKRMRLQDTLVSGKKLIREGEHELAFRLLEPYIVHKIENSAELYEQFAISAIKSGNEEAVAMLIPLMSKRVNVTTAARFIETLDSIGQFKLHSQMIEQLRPNLLDSVKIIRSFFKIRLRYSGGMSVNEYLVRLCSIKKGSREISYFIDALCRQEFPSKEVVTLILTSRSRDVDKLACMLTVNQTRNNDPEIRAIFDKILNLSKIDGSDPLTRKLFERSANLSFTMGDFEKSILLVERFSKAEKATKQMVASKLRSLLAVGNSVEGENYLNQNSGVFSEIQNLRFRLELGQRDFVIEQVTKMKIASLTIEESKRVAEILFRLNMHVEYCEIFRAPISKGDFTLSELTRYFHSLCKLGEEQRMIEEFEELRNFHSWSAESRAILAIVGYDFHLCDDYIEEIEIAISMEPNRAVVPIFVCESFISLERVDVSYYFLAKYIHLMQGSGKTSELTRKIGGALRDLEIEPNSICKENLSKKPIFSDVEAIRQLVKLVDSPSEKMMEEKRETGAKIAIHSHTLGIGGAERQVSLLLGFLAKGKVKSGDFSFITNAIPKGSDYTNSYYPKIEEHNIEIFEYNKPADFYGTWVSEQDFERILRHISPLKRNRILSLIAIYNKGDFNVAHTWQDWCNVYGGIAALLAGVDRVIMSGRTLPPEMKAILQARSGRSYKEAYKIILSLPGVEMIHNSNSGRAEYSKWLNVSEDNFGMIHNVVNTRSMDGKVTRRSSEIKKSLGISKNDLVIGYVGRFSSDKRPWIFLSIADIILSKGDAEITSSELEEWVQKNQSLSIGDQGELDSATLRKELDSIENTHFIMIGDGPQLEKARSIVDNSTSLNGRVHIVGYSSEVNAYLDCMDCLVLTSKIEGLPNVIIEAQFSGVPVLTTNAGGARECIIEGETGIVVDSGSVELMVSKLLEMINDSKFMKSASKKSKKYALKEFGQKTWIKRMNNLYGVQK